MTDRTYASFCLINGDVYMMSNCGEPKARFSFKQCGKYLKASFRSQKWNISTFGNDRYLSPCLWWGGTRLPLFKTRDRLRLGKVVSIPHLGERASEWIL